MTGNRAMTLHELIQRHGLSMRCRWLEGYDIDRFGRLGCRCVIRRTAVIVRVSAQQARHPELTDVLAYVFTAAQGKLPAQPFRIEGDFEPKFSRLLGDDAYLEYVRCWDGRTNELRNA